MKLTHELIPKQLDVSRDVFVVVIVTIHSFYSYENQEYHTQTSKETKKFQKITSKGSMR